MKILLASNNPKKAHELRTILANSLLAVSKSVETVSGLQLIIMVS